MGVEVPDPQCKVPAANAALLCKGGGSRTADPLIASPGCDETDANVSSLAVMELTSDWLGVFINQLSLLVRC